MIIAIDGPSGTGKSTVARAVAAELGFAFFDTGAMYRSVAWWVDQEKIDPQNEAEIARRLPEFRFEIRSKGKNERIYFVNDQDITTEIRSHSISSLASKVSTFRAV